TSPSAEGWQVFGSERMDRAGGVYLRRSTTRHAARSTIASAYFRMQRSDEHAEPQRGEMMSAPSRRREYNQKSESPGLRTISNRHGPSSTRPCYRSALPLKADLAAVMPFVTSTKGGR